jgi:hypothetical protein
MKPVPPKDLPPGQKVHYCIFHDESCFHANDQSNFVWMQEGEQPLRNKSRGRIVHVSDFIIESTESGRLSLTADQILAQLELPVAPQQPGLSNPSFLADISAGSADVASGTQTKKGRKSGKGKQPKEKNSRKTRATGRTEADHSWVPPPAPEGTEYRLPSFDARRIIFPGTNYDPWWDMPQLIAQACLLFLRLSHYSYPFRPAMRSRFSSFSTPTASPSSFLTVPQRTRHSLRTLFLLTK